VQQWGSKTATKTRHRHAIVFAYLNLDLWLTSTYFADVLLVISQFLDRRRPDNLGTLPSFLPQSAFRVPAPTTMPEDQSRQRRY
jgi:hypothetical protein